MAKACPINFQSIDETRIRIQAGLVMMIALLIAASGSALLGVLLVYDFGVRLFVSPKLSPLALIGTSLHRVFRLSEIKVDSAPKQFAAKLGLGFSVLITALSFLGFEHTTVALALILALCAGMEALFNYCVGCQVYALLKHLKLL